MRDDGWTKDQMSEFVHRCLGSGVRQGQHTADEWRAVHRALDKVEASDARMDPSEPQAEREPGSDDV
jgi:hypothetical protein